MAWTLGLDQLRGPSEGEDVGSDRPSMGSSLYYGPAQNGTRRQYGIAPANGRDQPWEYPAQTGIGGRLPTQPVLNGQTRPPWHVPLNGTTNPLGVASPNGYSRPYGLSPSQFERGADDGEED